jgi:hypothetical protein
MRTNLLIAAVFLASLLLLKVNANTLEQHGRQTSFGSLEQIIVLKKLLTKDPKGDFIAITWSVAPTDFSVEERILVYDRAAKRLWRCSTVRVGDQSMEPSWVSWTEVTDDKLRALSGETGFDLPGFRTGRGALPLSEKASAFVREELAKKGKK